MAYPTNNPKVDGKTAAEWRAAYKELAASVDALGLMAGRAGSPDTILRSLYMDHLTNRTGPRGQVQTEPRGNDAYHNLLRTGVAYGTTYGATMGAGVPFDITMLTA